jgi:hypothetical protein
MKKDLAVGAVCTLFWLLVGAAIFAACSPTSASSAQPESPWHLEIVNGHDVWVRTRGQGQFSENVGLTSQHFPDDCRGCLPRVIHHEEVIEVPR